MKSQITPNERLQLVGLLTLAEQWDNRCRDLRRVAGELLGDVDGTEAHIDDAMFCADRRDADKLLQRLKIEVVAPPPKPPPSER